MKSKSRTTMIKDPSFLKAIQMIRMSSSGLMQASETQINKAFKKVESLQWLSPEELSVLKASLNSRVKRSQSVFDRQVKSAVNQALKKIDTVSKKELNKLDKTVDRLERKIDRFAARA